MAVQEQHGSPTSDKILLNSNTDDKSVQSKKQCSTGDDVALKVRKSYTITKQRERWTEEEHKKFLEALKLHGRAWRKIEEHVGTKTAVQIRSHAQKFFSKIVRESNNGDASYAKAIEIPPPRPKRKPMHPYPRKLISPAKTGASVPQKLTRSVSQDSSISEQESQSPVSVLSTKGSDASVHADDSCTPNGSLSPVSSTLTLNAGTVFGSEVPKVMSDDARSQPGHEDDNPNPDEETPLKLELSSQNTDLAQEDQSAVQHLKLFGKTYLVKDPYSTLVTCKPDNLDKTEENCIFPWQVIPLKSPTSPPEYVLSAYNKSLMPLFCNEVKSDLFNPQTTSDTSNPVGACPPVALPWLTLCGRASLSTQEVHSPTPIRAQPCEKEKKLDKNEKNQVSSSGSNADLVSATSDREKSWDVDSLPSLVEKRGNFEKSFSFSKLSKRTSANSEDCRKGFVPYKRSSPEQNSAITSTETAEERKKQRIFF